MPPGVEHGLSGRVGQKANVFENSYEMPKGVEHCDKQLTTGEIPTANSYEMPKGVEHRTPPARQTNPNLANSCEMPKGVEHSQNREPSVECPDQANSYEMPKGVEHSSPLTGIERLKESEFI